MNVTLNLLQELSHRLRLDAAHHRMSADAYTLRLLDQHLPRHAHASDLVSLLRSWMDEEDAGGEQRETGAHLVRALDEHRLSHRQLFPAEQKGVPW